MLLAGGGGVEEAKNRVCVARQPRATTHACESTSISSIYSVLCYTTAACSVVHSTQFSIIRTRQRAAKTSSHSRTACAVLIARV